MTIKKLFLLLFLFFSTAFFLSGCNKKLVNTFGASDVSHPRYQHHTGGNLESALASDDSVLLFFGANRCPLCRALNTDIRANLDAIPSDLRIITFDYDSDEEQKKNYQVTSQHTLIYLDPDGNELKRTVKQETTLQQVEDQLESLSSGEAATADGSE